MSHVEKSSFLDQLRRSPLAAVVGYYASCLAVCSKALDYLKRNALLGRESADETSRTALAAGSHVAQQEQQTKPDANALRLVSETMSRNALASGSIVASTIDSSTSTAALSTSTNERPDAGALRLVSEAKPDANALRLVGFADRSLGNHIPSNTCKAGKMIRGKLENIGIYRANGREHFRGMVTVPLYSSSGIHTGEIGGLYGRRIDRHGQGPVEQHIGQGVFNGPVIREYDELIVCDRILDAWTLCAAGFSNAICAVDCQLQLADLKHVRRVLLCGDRIDCEPFKNCELHRLSLPAGQTIHSYAVERLHEVDALGKIIRASAWIGGSQIGGSQIGGSHSAAETSRTALAAGSHVAQQQHQQKPDANALRLVSETKPDAGASRLVSPVPRCNNGLDVTSSETETTITIENRRWRVRGLDRNKIAGVLRVNLLCYNTYTDRFHVDTFDLYHARSRWTFIEQAAQEIGAAQAQLRSDLGQVLLKLEELQYQQSCTGQEKALQAACADELSEPDRAAALELLRHEKLLEKILTDFEACGIVGERTGKLVGYLVATSRLLEKPLGLIIQSSSAAGKSSLAEAILGFMPEQSRLECSAMTGQSLYYLGHQDLQHKILSIAEEEGVRSASYQLKLLQSEGSLSLISTSKEKGSGRTATQRYTVTGPVALMLTTTASDIDPELMNRCLVISVDESPTQTAAIHAQQRFARTQAGMLQQIRRQGILRLHQNAQRLLRPLRVYNPYAQRLAFVGSQTRYRRDHQKYLTLIDTIALLHQYQRQVKTLDIDGQSIECLEVTIADIAMANKIADWALGKSIDDLPGPTRRLLWQLFEWASQQANEERIERAEFSFTRRMAREALGWNATHLRNQLERLVADEYVLPLGRRGQGKLHHYRLLFEGREGQSAGLGLTSATSLVDGEAASMTNHLALS